MPQITHSELAVTLAIEGVVAAIEGTVSGQAPVDPIPVGPRERADLGFSEAGDLLFYPIGDTGVFLYIIDAQSTVWFAGADCDKGAAALDAKVKQRYPQAKVAAEGPHKTERNIALRSYDIKLANGRVAMVEALYPTGRLDNPKFSIRVVGMERSN